MAQNFRNEKGQNFRNRHKDSSTVASLVMNAGPPRSASAIFSVKELVRERGYAKEKTIQKFIAAGYKKEQVMELLLGIALKTISNYLDHISPTPLDHALAGESK
jgi:hypothetical protein